MVVDYIFSKLNIKKMENRNWFSIFYSIKFIRSNNKITFTLIRTFIFFEDERLHCKYLVHCFYRYQILKQLHKI